VLSFGQFIRSLVFAALGFALVTMTSLPSARGRDTGLRELTAARSQAQAPVVFLAARMALPEPGESLLADHRR
jgi:hypothetical protein